MKTSLIYSVLYSNLGGLGAWFGGLSPAVATGLLFSIHLCEELDELSVSLRSIFPSYFIDYAGYCLAVKFWHTMLLGE